MHVIKPSNTPVNVTVLDDVSIQTLVRKNNPAAEYSCIHKVIKNPKYFVAIYPKMFTPKIFITHKELVMDSCWTLLRCISPKFVVQS